jgi:hypothetical protein
MLVYYHILGGRLERCRPDHGAVVIGRVAETKLGTHSIIKDSIGDSADHASRAFSEATSIWARFRGVVV